jgi:hypothetical protein
LYERTYATIPAARTGSDPSGYGDIPYQAEDLLLALRLLQPGDITFVSQAMVGDDGNPMSQLPYRYFSAISSTHPYHLATGQLPEVAEILRLLETAAASSTWFSVAKRFFLYGGAKEFNPYIGELDRILDLAIALEAVLMFEHDFINRLIKRRAIALLGVPPEQSGDVSRLLGRFYGYRSTIAHGDPLPIEDAADFHGQMVAFEVLVRSVLRSALQVIPADGDARKQKLTELASITDAERIEQLVIGAKRLEDPTRQTRVLDALQN